MSTSLLTDHYELTMVEAAMRSGTAFRRCVFELFPRQLPPGRRYGVVAGTGRALEALATFHFDPDEVDFLTRTGVVGAQMADWLKDYHFSGSISGYAEGDLYFPGSPLLTVEGTFAEACLLETLLLSIYNHDSAVASAASRMTLMAEGRPIIEMGSRRTHEESAVAAARAAWIAGFGPTSNLAAGYRYGVPTSGTAAHAFTLLHDNESDAFTAQLAAYGRDTTLLVDTYDIEAGVREAVRLTDGELGAVRIDSGDLTIVARQAGRYATCSTTWARRRPGSSSPPTSTSGRSPRCAVPRWTATGSAPRWSPDRANRPARSSTRWWHEPPTRTPTHRWCRWPRSRPTSRRWEAASTRYVVATTRESPRRRLSASTRRSPPPGWIATCSSNS